MTVTCSLIAPTASVTLISGFDAHLQDDAVADVGIESLQHDLQLIRSDRQVRQRVRAISACEHRADRAGVGLRDGDFGARESRRRSSRGRRRRVASRQSPAPTRCRVVTSTENDHADDRSKQSHVRTSLRADISVRVGTLAPGHCRNPMELRCCYRKTRRALRAGVIIQTLVWNLGVPPSSTPDPTHISEFGDMTSST